MSLRERFLLPYGHPTEVDALVDKLIREHLRPEDLLLRARGRDTTGEEPGREATGEEENGT